MQIEGTKLIFVMDFSVLHFFKYASRMPQIAQAFNIFRRRGRGGGGGGGGMLWTPPRNFLLFFPLAIPGSVYMLFLMVISKL